MSLVEELQNQQRELLALMSATLWVLEHPDVNAIKFCGNPRELAKHIRRHMANAGMGEYKKYSHENTAQLAFSNMDGEADQASASQARHSGGS